MNDALTNLHDIHLPTAIDWWPFAWGWWVLFLTLLISLSMLSIMWYKRRYRRLAIKRLNAYYQQYEHSLQKQRYVSQLVELLRILAITRYGRENVAALQGETWINFLNSKTKKPLFNEALLYLTQAPYCAADYFAAHFDAQLNIKVLHTMAINWIKQHQ